MIRIWHQSMTILGDLPGYTRLMQDHANRVCDADTVVDLHGMLEGTYPQGIAPIRAAAFAWPHHLSELQIVENVIRAEHEGYDAVGMSCMGDPQLDICRSLVNIPVVSAFETSLLIASTAARAFGILVLDRDAVRRARARVKRYGFDGRVVAIEACEPAIDEYELHRGFEGDPVLVDRLRVQMQKMAEAGADIIIPAEGVLNAVLVHNEVHNVGGVPVFDSYGAVMTMAEMLVKLQRRTGLRNAKTGAYGRPDPNVVQHFRETALRVLTEAQQRS